MPPKKQSSRNAPAAAAAPAVERAATFREQVLTSLDKAHRTTGNIAAVKKMLVSHCRERLDEVASVIAEITRAVFAQATALAPEALRRHNNFLRETCDEIRTVLGGCDETSCAALEEVVAFGHAQEKAVRYAAASSCAVLLKTLNPEVSNDARMALYDNIALLLKYWLFDKCHLVREKAAETITIFRQKDDLHNCDVTPLLLAVSAEDYNPAVRKVTVTMAPDKSTYFFDVARSTRDTSAKVRTAAWEVLSKFKLTHAVEYHAKLIDFLTAKGIPKEQFPADLTARIALGLQDQTVTVRKATKLALTHVWLQRDFHNDVEALLSALPYNSMYSVVVAKELYDHHVLRMHQAAAPASDAAANHEARGFPLNLKSITISGLLLWRMSCVDSVERVADENDHVLLPVKTYAEVLVDVIQTLIDQSGTYAPKVASLSETVDAETAMELLLSLLPVYATAGYLAHTESAVRTQLIRQLSYILRVIPNKDVAAFVADSVAGINALCSRDPTDAREAVSTAIVKLSKFLSFVHQQQVSFDDPVAYAKRDEERRILHNRALARGHLTAEDTARAETMSLDRNFLSRMLKIVHEYLGQSQRGDPIPAVCAQVTELSRSQTDEGVKATAIRCLALQCLINPEMVHTFLPLLLETANDPSASCAACALGAVFDLIGEFGLPFFDVGSKGTHDTAAQAAGATTADARRKQEHAIAQQDSHKVGGQRLIYTLLPYLRSEVASCRMVATAGFCKLLAANRLDDRLVVVALADILVTSAAEPRKYSHVASVVDTFVGSYARSQAGRLFRVAEAGVLAVRILLAMNPTQDQPVTGLLARLIHVTDASLLRSLQELDPEYASRVKQDYAAAAEAEAEKEAEDEDAPTGRATTGKGGLRHAVLGNNRIQRELDANSIHEYILLELLVETSATDEHTIAQSVCLGALRRLLLYRRDPSVTSAILALGDRCLASVKAQENRDALRQYLQEYKRLAEGNAIPMLVEPMCDALRRLVSISYEERVATRDLQLAEMVGRGFVAAAAVADPAAPAARRGGGGTRARQPRAEDPDTFEVDALVQQPRRKTARRET